jgi:hypothetical protein
MRPDLLAPQRAAFDVPADVADFNTAMLAPQLHAVRAAGAAALEFRGRPWAISSIDWFADVEHLRALFARIVGGDAEGVAVVRATSYGFAVAARNLPLRPGQRVLVLARRAGELRLDPAPAAQRGPHMLGVRLPAGAGAYAIRAA